jgi:hypothetical protein
MKAVITQSNYIPWKGYFDAIATADVFVLYDDMQYTRRDWRNRNKIKTANGIQWLTIAVDVKNKFHQKINETRISETGWNRTHWETIRHAYARAPFFNDYREFFEELYMKATEQYLSELNFKFLNAFCELLGIKPNFRWSSEFELRGEKSERLLNLCLDLKADAYYSGPAAKDYLDVGLFNENNIAVNWFDYSGYAEYPQLHGEFEHGVSIIDLIFNTGPGAARYLKLNTNVPGDQKKGR